ncbi:MAG: DNA-directed RNA polymerase subunit omega [Bacillota bacterium]
MINRPPEKEPIIDSKYSLVVAVAKRARQIVNRRDPGVVLAHKPVTIALQEIESGAVRVVPKADEVLSDVQASAEPDLPLTEDPSQPEQSLPEPQE